MALASKLRTPKKPHAKTPRRAKKKLTVLRSAACGHIETTPPLLTSRAGVEINGVQILQIWNQTWAEIGLWCALMTIAVASEPTPRAPPNVVLVTCDDLGWGDLGCYGARGHRTPNLDRLAREGSRFTSFYVSQPVCSASRASLLTGCYANRVGIHGALMPDTRVALHPTETTIAEILKTRGYATACVGKWHLGRPAQYLPTHHGFDEYFGLPYSNDMWPNNPAAAGDYPPLPLIEGDQVVEEQPDQSQLTQRYTTRAVQFIERNRARPFFLYLAHSMPHVPLFASARFRGHSRAGLYGDVIEELDWSVGQVVATLRRLGLERNTLVIFTSDNGPWQLYGDHAGAKGPFRGAKASAFEGGVRVPFIARWPGRISRGRVSDVPLMTIDLLPTLARLAEAPLPERAIDGRDVWPLLCGTPGATNPHSAYGFWYNHNELHAVRSGAWKLILPHRANLFPPELQGLGGARGTSQVRQVELGLYDLAGDPGESRNLAASHPADLGRMLGLAEDLRIELGDALTGRAGRGNREPARW